jgi:hypothetical protein
MLESPPIVCVSDFFPRRLFGYGYRKAFAQGKREALFEQAPAVSWWVGMTAVDQMIGAGLAL